VNSATGLLVPAMMGKDEVAGEFDKIARNTSEIHKIVEKVRPPTESQQIEIFF
jgi:hypothetical protein